MNRDETAHKRLKNKLETCSASTGISEQRLGNLAMLEWDLKGHITYASPAVTWIIGYTPEEMKRGPIKRYLAATMLPKLGIALRDKVVKGLQLTMRRKDGSLVNVEASVGHLSGVGWWLEFRRL
jgi:PAS domain-containing protein